MLSDVMNKLAAAELASLLLLNSRAWAVFAHQASVLVGNKRLVLSIHWVQVCGDTVPRVALLEVRQAAEAAGSGVCLSTCSG